MNANNQASFEKMKPKLTIEVILTLLSFTKEV